MQLDEAKQILNRAGLIAEEIEWGSRPKFYPSKKAVKKAPPVEDVEVEDDERTFCNEHTDYGNALQFIIKNICPTNESVNESANDYREIVTKKLAQIYDRCYDSDDAGRSYAEKQVADFEPQIAEVLEEGGDSPISPYEVAEVIWYMLHHSQLMGKSILGVYWRYTRNEPDFFETWYQFNP